MSQKMSKIEITDIWDDLSEDFRRQLIQNKPICVSKLDSNLNYNQMKEEIKRLKSDLNFANKCLNTLNKFKKYMNKIRYKFENLLDLREKLELNSLEIEYNLMVKKFNERNGEKSCLKRHSEAVNNEDIECEDNYYIKQETEEFIEYSDTEDIDKEIDLNSNEKTPKMANNSDKTIDKTNEENNQNSKNEVLNSDSVPIYFSDNFFNEIEIIDQNNDHKKRSPQNVDIDRDINDITSHSEYDPNNDWSENYSEEREVLQTNEIINPHLNNESSVERRHFGNNLCQFPKCGLKVETKELEKHMNKHLSDIGLNWFKCDENKCDFKTKNYNLLISHDIRQHKHNIIKRETPLKCDYKRCHYKKLFFSVASLERHKQIMHLFQENGLYVCPISSCGKTYQKKPVFDRHLFQSKIHSEKEVRLLFNHNCNHCLFGTNLLSTLIRHKSRYHKKEDKSNSVLKSGPPFCCPVIGCQRSFELKDNLNRHLIFGRQHLSLEFDPNLKFKCQFCSFRCDSLNWLKKHLTLHSEFKCSFCNNNYFSAKGLSIHLRKYHKTVETSINCTLKECNKTFKSYYKRNYHLKHDHNIKKTYPCDYPKCEYVAKSYTQLKDHKCEHTGETRYKCDWPGCEFKTQTRDRFNYHKYRFHLSRIFKCDLCQFETKFEKQLKNHISMKHTNEKPFICEVCSKPFKAESRLKAHKKLMHSGIQSFKCNHNGCEETFNTQQKRNNHIKCIHEQKYRCDWPECGFIAAYPCKLKDHKTLHTGQSPFICDWPECGWIARNKKTLTHHKYRHTGERPYPCTWPQCGKRFRDDSTLATHMRLHKQDLCYKCVWPGCDYATYDRSGIRTHRMRHEKKMKKISQQKSPPKPKPKLKVKINSVNNSVKKSKNKKTQEI